MLKRKQNQLMTRTGPSTPGGALFRRYWQPVALSEELPAGGVPLPVRILGEDLVLFRDDAGRPGLLGLHCSHRGADLSYGRVEDGGLRCLYHGWLYDIQGSCLEQPAEARGRDYKRKIHQRAYPCREAGNLIFTYMGPGEPPLMPAYEFFAVPDSHRHATKVHQECNYLQANEGNIDPPHIAFLHRREDAAAYRVDGPGVLNDGAVRRALLQQDAAPNFEVEATAFGFRIVQTREIGSDDTYFLTVTNFIMPNASAFGSDGDAYRVAWHVPIDDEHHWRYMLLFSRAAPLDHDRLADPELTADYRLIRNKANRYLQDREEMRAKTFSGMGTSFKALDVHVTEGQGPIMDRTQEHLGPGDRAIIAARRMLLAAIADVQAGRDPPFVVRSPEPDPVAELDAVGVVLPTAKNWREFWDQHWDMVGRRGASPVIAAP
jgi:phenylpropionate dioxygenase-like ring-hydroxylating dioxygenase large terminal subunit